MKIRGIRTRKGINTKKKNRLDVNQYAKKKKKGRCDRNEIMNPKFNRVSSSGSNSVDNIDGIFYNDRKRKHFRQMFVH